MKKLFLLLVVSMVFATASFAQLKAAKAEWVTIQTPNARCWSCMKLLTDYVTTDPIHQSGIIKIQVNMPAGTTRVQFYNDRTNLDYIRTSFNNAGFDADSTKATPDSYKLLPPQCKRIAEGGGQKKGAKPCHVDPALLQ